MAKTSKNTAPSPMISKGKPADWVFIFKFNAKSFPKCDRDGSKKGIFGGTMKSYNGKYSQQYIYASSKNPKLQKGKGCIGTSLDDPLGATFDQIYNGDLNYVVWNDQFYGDPIATGSSPWGHSKGCLCWNDKGEGMVLQVSTPSWPGSGSKDFPRKTDGNTLGTIKDDDIEVSQHFFALKLTKRDVIEVLQGMQNASVLTKTSKPQIFKNGGPADIQALAKTLGKKVDSTKVVFYTLSSGAKMISKPSNVHVPPWQLVSAKLGGIPLRVASWWARPEIPSTDKNSHISCWVNGLGNHGAVEIATTGVWDGVEIGLTGGMGTGFNHAKIGVSQNAKKTWSIFGDMNQQGAIRPGSAYRGQRCTSSQNGRGGIFYAIDDPVFWKSLTALLAGKSAPLDGDTSS